LLTEQDEAIKLWGAKGFKRENGEEGLRQKNTRKIKGGHGQKLGLSELSRMKKCRTYWKVQFGREV